MYNVYTYNNNTSRMGSYIIATIIYWCAYLSIEERKKLLVIKAREHA